MTNTFKSTSCRVCGSESVAEQLHPREMMFGTREEFSYFRCGECGCLQIDEIPADLAKHYPANYYSFGQVSNSPSTLGAKLKRHWLFPAMTKHILYQKSFFGHVLCHLVKHPPVPAWMRFLNQPIFTNDAVLDVGCGSGLNLMLLCDCGFKNLRGVDPFISQSVVHENGVCLDKCELAEVQGNFNLIMLHHVFEHLIDPIASLKQAARLLVGGGQILIRIPLVDSLAARKYGKDWVQLDAPRHITLSTRKSMEHVARIAGLKITRVTYDSNDFQFWGSEQYLQDIPLFDPRSRAVNVMNGLFSQEQIKAYSEQAEQLNRQEQGDQAAFVLEKA